MTATLPAGFAKPHFAQPATRTVAVVRLVPSLALAQPLPQPWTGGSCANGYTRSGSFCVPREGAQDAIALSPNGNCPHGWTRSGSYASAAAVGVDGFICCRTRPGRSVNRRW